MGLDLESMPVSELPKVIREVNNNITESIVECLNPALDYFICFDELDRGFEPKEASYLQMIIGLLLAAKALNEKCRAAGKRMSVLIFLRDDIYQLLKFEDKNKITETLVSRIEWDSERTKWTLRQLMERRFSTAVGEGAAVPWGAIFDEEKEMPGRQSKYNHMLDRTFRRPRDIIKFSNEVLSSYKALGGVGQTFSNDCIVAAREKYSEYLLSELEDEIHKHIPEYESYLEVLRSVGTANFTREEIESACVRRKDLFTDAPRPMEMLRHLFEFSVVAYQRTGGVGGGSEYVWRHLDGRARFDEAATNFRVHPGLLEALNLKKFTVRKPAEQ